MRNQIIRLLMPLFFIALFNSCNKSNDPSSNSTYTYKELRYIELFNYSKDSISNTLAVALNVNPITFNRIAPKYDLPIKTGIGWVKEGYEYLAVNSAKITVWTDSIDHPYLVTYELRRGGISSEWSNDQNKMDSIIISILGIMEISTSGETLYKSDIAGLGRYWYDISLNQKFDTESVVYPFIQAEVEGDTLQVNFIYINRWYVNLNEISQLITDNELKNIAYNYFLSSPQVIIPPILDSMKIIDFDIVRNKLCRRTGKAIIDQYGSYMNLYIDIQNGNIVAPDYHTMR